VVAVVVKAAMVAKLLPMLPMVLLELQIQAVVEAVLAQEALVRLILAVMAHLAS
jgi:hypothetical protein